MKQWQDVTTYMVHANTARTNITQTYIYTQTYTNNSKYISGT